MFSRPDISSNKISNSTVVQGNNNVVITNNNIPTEINTLPSDNPYFKGRYDTIKSIMNKFQSFNQAQDEKLVVLYGAGGIGKTSIAYKFASSVPNISIRIRIRMENRDVAKEDFCQIANLLSLDIDNKSLSEIANLVNAKLDQYYGDAGGVIVFDNVASYKEPFSKLRTETTGAALRKYFPRSKKFLVVVTTRDSLHWPKKSLLPIFSLSPREAVDLFQSVAPSRQFNSINLSAFLKSTLGGSPLAICLAASYLEYHAGVSLEQYIQLYKARGSAIQALMDSQPMLPESTFGGETPKHRQVIFSTFDINLSAIETRNKIYLVLLQHAALMHPDAIGKTELYNVGIEKNSTFDRDDFEIEVKKTSLLHFERNNEITMHRIIQFVLLLKISDQSQLLYQMIQTLFEYFSRNFLASRISFANFSYILRNIIDKNMFYASLNMSDVLIIKGLFLAAEQYMHHGEIDEAILFLSDALQHVKRDAEPDLYNRVMGRFRDLLNNSFELTGINQAWLTDLLQKIDFEGRRVVLGILFEKEKALSAQDRDFEIYHSTEISLAYGVIGSYKGRDIRELGQEEIRYLIRAHYIAGRTFRERAAGLKTRMEKIHTLISTIESEIDNLSNKEKYLKKSKKIKIKELQDSFEHLHEQYSRLYKGSQTHQKAVIDLSRQYNMTNEMTYVLAEIQFVRLYKLDKTDIPEIRVFAEDIAKNASRLQEQL